MIYLNGSEAARSNMPDGEITSATTALSAVGGRTKRRSLDVPLDRNLIREGDNVIAVELHQSGGRLVRPRIRPGVDRPALPNNTAPTAEAGGR